MTSVLRRFRQYVGWSFPSHGGFQSIADKVLQAERIIIVYYAASIYMSAALVIEIGALTRDTAQGAWDFLWPLVWVDYFDANLVLELLSILTLIGALAALQFRRYRLVRLVFALLFFLTATSVNSTGGINHPYHAWLMTGFVFVLLPDGRIEEFSRASRMSYLTVLLTAQAMFMLTYTMAGLWKVVLGAVAFLADIPGNFSSMALSWTIANRSLQTGTSPLLADFVVLNPLVVWPGFLAVMYVQVFALVATFRPRLHVLWAYALISFHIGTWLTMEIIFIQHALLLTILFVMSPFAPRNEEMSKLIRDLPLEKVPFLITERMRQQVALKARVTS